jgi:hypothetical protein
VVDVSLDAIVERLETADAPCALCEGDGRILSFGGGICTVPCWLCGDGGRVTPARIAFLLRALEQRQPKPPAPRVQHDDQGELDEVAFTAPRGVVLERMDDDRFQLRVQRADGGFTHVELAVTEDRPLDGPQGPFLAGTVEVDP